MDLTDFFSAAEARTDRWCEMNTEFLNGFSARFRYSRVHQYQSPKDSQHDYRFILNYDFPLL